MEVQVTIDSNSGFCFGVLYAIEMAEEVLDDEGQLYCLGDIVHNDQEVNRLKAKGLEIIDHQRLHHLNNCKVLIRAHGEPPETYKLALDNNIELIDASCPVVLKLQNRVRNAYDPDTQIVIYGKDGHAEVIGLLGQTNNEAVVISSMDDLDKLDYSRPIELFSQTTKATASFYAIQAELQRRSQAGFKGNDTICRQVSNREPQLQEFSKQNDVIIFAAGAKSSNGKVLYGVCKATNDRSYFVSSADEVQAEWLAGAATVGVCGATSTPMWLMEQVASRVQQLHSPALA